ncbi:hypothetical protein BRC82_02690 [Halobacteriales archaeon QS_1_67_19]|nr:MAG: hypothetical protein BRC82_02690 [Halobacteriales archaeon QS_1_67_19]
MEQISLTVPDPIVESLPADGEDAARDMREAVDGWEARLNRVVEDGDDEEAAEAVVDALERFENRWEEYDDYVAELRAWGQSPIYAMAWRDLMAALMRQLYDHDELADRIDRERHARLVEDGIRPGR